MQHFLSIDQLSLPSIESLIQRAHYFKHKQQYPNYSSYCLANLFYENSTRTRVSFEWAAKQLALNVINLPLASSSESKGESIEDTLLNLAAMNIHLMVIRHSQNHQVETLAKRVGNRCHLINAGDGTHAHPSQALLDLMTIQEVKPHFADLKVAILGDIKHSRVANSLQAIFAKVGIKQLHLIAPKRWLPEKVSFGHSTESLEEGLHNADVIICLRVQKERLNDLDHVDLCGYRKQYALTSISRLYARANAMIMHPGPVNRGIEIDDEVVDGEHSYILQQVSNGVYMRMAIIESLLLSPKY